MTLLSSDQPVPASRARRDFRLLLILAGGILLRLLALPFAQVAHGDAVSRVFITWTGLSDPLSYLQSNWRPFHFFLIAGALKIWHDPIYSPMILHILFSVATAIPVFAFVRREWGEGPALYVTAASLLYPLAFRQSFMALTEVPFVFFIMCAVNDLSRVRFEPLPRFAALSGLCMTAASALRMEAWILIPCFAILLRKKWKLAFLFLAISSLVPVLSMASNYLTSGDPVPGLTAAKTWQIQMEGVNEQTTTSDIIERFLFFPAVVFFGLTPFFFGLCVTGVVLAFKHRKNQAEWLLPFVTLLAIFIRQTSMGFLTPQVRYSLTLGYLLLPFAAETFLRFRTRKSFRIALVVILALMIPLSYSRVVVARVFGSRMVNPFPADLEAIPRVSRNAAEVARNLSPILKPDREGLVLDFFGWKDTYYVGLMSKLHPTQIWFLPGGLRQPFDSTRFAQFVSEYPAGLIIRSAKSRDIQLTATGTGDLQLVFPGESPELSVTPIETVQDLTIYRYQLVQ